MLVEDYIPVAIFAIVAILFPVLTFWITKFFRPSDPSKLKGSTYECGESPVGEAQIQFHFQYYMYAIIFVVFDVVMVFFLLWAFIYYDLSLESKLLMAVFLGTLIIGVTYALKKEARVWI
jgi:NADH:ubiquinone oxidoreductase subunit 3 (subunit A)